MHTIWRRLFGIVVLSVVALVGLAACQSAEPAAAPTATPASAEAQSAAPPAQSAGPGRPYSDPQLDRLGANGEVQFLNSFATW